eukprot:364958-Amphidinium_carterae.1
MGGVIFVVGVSVQAQPNMCVGFLHPSFSSEQTIKGLGAITFRTALHGVKGLQTHHTILYSSRPSH